MSSLLLHHVPFLSLRRLSSYLQVCLLLLLFLLNGSRGEQQQQWRRGQPSHVPRPYSLAFFAQPSRPSKQLSILVRGGGAGAGRVKVATTTTKAARAAATVTTTTSTTAPRPADSSDVTSMITSSSSSSSSRRLSRQAQLKFAMWAVSGVAITMVGYHHRQTLAPLFDKKLLQDSTLSILETIEQKGWYGIFLYVIGLALWEFAGLSTIPVETAAGMAFGFERGLVASGAGKMLGAVAAFGLGRSVLNNWVRTKFGDNAILQLIDGSVAAHPMRVSFLLKYSCFPELIKNFGSSMFQPIRLWMFMLATAVHGWSFTALWTYLGLDAARRLKNVHEPSNRVLQAALAVAMLIGIVGSPLMMAWWVRDMRNNANQQQSVQQRTK